MAETAFRIAYEGPALESGRMPVRDLAPALLALGELFTEASTVLYPDREPVSLSIRATDVGSFEAHLILEVKRAWDAVVNIFGSDSATAIVNLKDLVLVGLFLFVKKLRGRTIAKREALEPGQVRVTLEDGTSIECSAETLMLYDRTSIREKAREVLEPLAREGVDRVVFRPEDQPDVTVSADDLPAFDIGESAGDVLGDWDRVVHLQVVSPTFREKNKWRLSDGASTFWAQIADPEFLGHVDQGERFGKGDMLRCVLRVIQTQTPDGALHADYVVERVLAHIAREEQLRMPSEGSPPPRELPPGDDGGDL